MKFLTTTWMPKKVFDMRNLVREARSSSDGGYPPDRPPARPKDPLRPERMPVMVPVDRDARTDTRPKPDGFCLPTPLPPPRVRDEKIVGRKAGRYADPAETFGGATRACCGATGGVCQP